MLNRSLVIDQATSKLGFAIVEDDPNIEVSYGVTGRLIQHGRILAKGESVTDRLLVIKADVEALIQTFKPTEMVLENTNFRQQNFQASNALGAVFLCLKDLAKSVGLAFYTQHPKTIKKATGNGVATKADMIAAARQYWGLENWQVKDDNHADALVAAFAWLMFGDAVRQRASK